ncbi:O-antigen ligase family protein [Halomonas sp. EGI 63088]|uniref:O-antigen ligase family protein n=1 Tax=Halomonas flagellata TaxID=2920385 RepID=A0ABS9RZY7_9GAMM|nr:O-antigen ligase family protein [Halomonas flagellata]MCH4565428.1 O-antigen ligase family protein [Halomonas flagellata]
MNSVFSRERAVSLNAGALFLVLVLLIATPVRSHIVIALVMLYALAYLVVHRASLAVNRFDWAVIGLISLYLVSQLPAFVLADFESRYLSAPLHMVASIPVYLMLRHAAPAISLGQYRRWLEGGAVIGSLGGALLALYQTQWLGWHRADGFLFSINFGYLACALAFICAALMRGSTHKAWLLLGALAATLSVILTLTRGAILAVPLLLGWLLVLNADRLGWHRLIATGVAFLMLVFGSYFILPTVQDRVDYTILEFSKIIRHDFSGTSSGGRIELWTSAIRAFIERPLIGLTYNEREALNATLVDQGALTEWVLTVSRSHAHSQYFEMLATGGGLGIVALLGYLVAPGLYQFRLYRQDRSNTYALTGLLFTSGFGIYGLTEVALQHEMIAAFYAYVQVTLLVLALKHRETRAA